MLNKTIVQYIDHLIRDEKLEAALDCVRFSQRDYPLSSTLWDFSIRLNAALNQYDLCLREIDHVIRLKDHMEPNIDQNPLFSDEGIKAIREAWEAYSTQKRESDERQREIKVAEERNNQWNNLISTISSKCASDVLPEKRILLLGNCQAGALGRVLSYRLTDYHVATGQTLLRSNIDDTDLDVLASKLIDTYTYIYMQPEVSHHRVGRVLKEHSTNKTNLYYFPSLSFIGFHPDFAAFGYRSPMNGCHSLITLYGWANKLSVSQTLAMFNDVNFETLGFYSSWHDSVQFLKDQALEVNINIEKYLNKWLTSEKSFLVPTHPSITIMNDICTELMLRDGFEETINKKAETLPADPFVSEVIWPVYPEIAANIGCAGSYTFSRQRGDDRVHWKKPTETLSLQSFVEESFQQYTEQKIPRAEVLDFLKGHLGYEDSLPTLIQEIKVESIKEKVRVVHPYSKLNPYQYWNRSFDRKSNLNYFPNYKPKFKLTKDQKIAVAGSCFASNIVPYLKLWGYNFLNKEPSSSNGLVKKNQNSSDGVYSAQYGNIYTAKQLEQTFDRAFGTFNPSIDLWETAENKFIDPFRPNVFGAGLEKGSDVRRERTRHLNLVKRVFEETDVFIFTLGLTEAWRAKSDQAVYPIAPGVLGGRYEKNTYEYVNYDYEETLNSLEKFFEKLKSVNSNCKVILTVSPVSLAATYEDRDVMISTIESKSILRSVAGKMSNIHEQVDYFPSYEIICGHQSSGSFFNSDGRSVSKQGISHVMNYFANQYNITPDSYQYNTKNLKVLSDLTKTICDEERLAE